jgi:hypothetical protein
MLDEAVNHPLLFNPNLSAVDVPARTLNVNVYCDADKTTDCEREAFGPPATTSSAVSVPSGAVYLFSFTDVPPPPDFHAAFEKSSVFVSKLTRAEIEEIRGVEVIGVLETLLERKLVKVAGRKETVGRPLLYATTHEFLRHFNLWKISDLPSLEDLAKEAERKSATENGSAEAPSETAPSGETQAAEAEPAAEPAPQDSTPVEESSPGEPAV